MEAYVILGTRLQIDCDRPEVSELIRHHWRPFEAPLDEASPPAVVIHIGPLRGRTADMKSQYFCGKDFFLWAERRKWVITGTFLKRPHHVHIQASTDLDSEYLYFYRVEPVILSVLKRFSVLHWHGGAVAKDGRCILLPGVSGSGKSTTLIDFLELGFDFVSDDVVFLTKENDQVLARGIDDSLFVTDNTLRYFPGLESSVSATRFKKGKRKKRRIDVQGRYPTAIDRLAPVEMILFPRVSKTTKSSVRRISGTRAFFKCLRQEPKELKGLLDDPVALKNQFEIYSGLAATARCYELILGKDRKKIGPLLSACFKGEKD